MNINLKSILPVALIALALSPIGFIFQNCAGSSFGEDNSSVLGKETLQNCTDPSCGSINNGTASCTFNGQTIAHNSSVQAFLNSSVPASVGCQAETRLCTNGVLSGTYQYGSCVPDAPRSCLFNGNTINHGGTVTAYLSSTVPVGTSCDPEVRTCNDGTLSGSFAYASCAPSVPASCLFNGMTIASGAGVFAFPTSTVPSGQTCTPQFRLCVNGNLSGTATYATCAPDTPASCMFNGVTVASGDTVIAAQNSTVAAGMSCQYQPRLCTNGVLSGSYNYNSCTVDNPASCLFNGVTVPSGGNVLAYLTSSVAAGSSCQQQSRSCVNGALSGSYAYSACVVDQPASCMFNGQMVGSGQKVTAFQTSSVAAGQVCASEERSCLNGNLSGSYVYASCAPNAPVSCRFDGRDIAHGEFVISYQSNSVPAGQVCTQQARLCNNGVLSGSYAHGSCTVEARSCLFNGNNVAHGTTIKAYKVPSVAAGETCEAQAEMRTCNDGTLSGTALSPYCQVSTAISCLFNGTTVNDKGTVTAYQAPTVPAGQTCVSETRTCNNGNLTGSYLYKGCHVGAPKSCTLNGITIADGATIKAYSSGSVPHGTSCTTIEVTRVCTNGVLSGTATHTSCQPAGPASCNFHGKTIAHGNSVKAFTCEWANYGIGCDNLSEMRKCNNGKLSGSANFPNCVGGTRWVAIGNRNIGHGDACAEKGLVKDEENDGGTCISGEARPNSNVPDDVYVHGKWGNKDGAGTVHGRYCYRKGQKKDDDKTDLIVGYLCRPKEKPAK